VASGPPHPAQGVLGRAPLRLGPLPRAAEDLGQALISKTRSAAPAALGIITLEALAAQTTPTQVLGAPRTQLALGRPVRLQMRSERRPMQETQALAAPAASAPIRVSLASAGGEEPSAAATPTRAGSARLTTTTTTRASPVSAGSARTTTMPTQVRLGGGTRPAGLGLRRSRAPALLAGGTTRPPEALGTKEGGVSEGQPLVQPPRPPPASAPRLAASAPRRRPTPVSAPQRRTRAASGLSHRPPQATAPATHPTSLSSTLKTIPRSASSPSRPAPHTRGRASRS